MKQSNVFEKTVAEKERVKLMREQAIMERDLNWIKEHNEKRAFVYISRCR